MTHLETTDTDRWTEVYTSCLQVDDKKRLMRLTNKFHFHEVKYHGRADSSICFCCLCSNSKTTAIVARNHRMK